MAPIESLQMKHHRLSVSRGGSLLPTWWKFILGGHLFFLSATVLFPYLPFVPLSKKYLMPLNLGLEMNIAAWWSGVNIFLAGILAYEIFSSGTKITHFAWLSISMILIGLSYDEICSIHERVGSFKGYIPYASILFLLFLFSFSVLFLNKRTRKSAVLIGCGFMMYGLAALQEYLEHNLAWPLYLKGFRVGLEEGTELFGTFVIMLGIISQRKIRFNQESPFSLLALIPDVSKLKGYRILFIVGSVLNMVTAFLICPVFDVAGKRGSLSIWYPTVFFLSIACLFALKVSDNAGYRKKLLFGLSGIFLVSSMYCMYPLYRFIPKITLLVPQKILKNVNVIFTLQLLGLFLYHRTIKPLLKSQIVFLLLILAATSISLFTEARLVHLQILSVSTLFLAVLFSFRNRNRSVDII